MVSGMPEIEAKRYEEKLKKGNYLIAAHTDESEDVDRAKGRFHAMSHEKWSCDDGQKCKILNGRPFYLMPTKRRRVVIYTPEKNRTRARCARGTVEN